jgi:2-methylcitrate dehydratase
MTATLDAYDATTLHLAEWASGLRSASLTHGDRDALVWHHLDSVGCAIGAHEAEVCRAVRRLAATASIATGGVSVVGMPGRVASEQAALANATMVRYLDFNDNYLRLGGGHTSDIIPAVWAAAELHGARGADLLLGLHAGYETFAAFADAVPLRDRGWDYPLFIAVAAAVGAAVVLELGVEQIANAVAMAVTPAVPLGVTRVGRLSNWKGLASPFATTTGLLAARFAAEGLTGPPQSIEGVRGLWSLVTGKFSLDRLGVPLDGLSAAERSAYKLSVAEFNSQGPIAEFIRLHDAGVRPDDVESIRIATYFVAWSEIGGGQNDAADKWDPRNRETADHSLPYMCAVALTDGRLQADSYRPERFLDPALRPLMQRIEVVEDPEITASWVAVPAHRISVRLTDGTTSSIRVDYPRGHPGNPATHAELERKFRDQVSPVLAAAGTDLLLSTLSGLPDLGTLEPFFAQLRAVPTLTEG